MQACDFGTCIDACSHVCWCTRMCASAWMCALACGGVRSMLGIFLSLSSPYSLKPGFNQAQNLVMRLVCCLGPKCHQHPSSQMLWLWSVKTVNPFHCSGFSVTIPCTGWPLVSWSHCLRSKENNAKRLSAWSRVGVGSSRSFYMDLHFNQAFHKRSLLRIFLLSTAHVHAALSGEPETAFAPVSESFGEERLNMVWN